MPQPHQSRPSAWKWMFWAALTAWYLAVFAAFRPGLLSPDSISQLQQGLSGQYATTHPPLLSWLAGVAFRLGGSSWPLLAVQLGGLVAGLVVLTGRGGPRGYQWLWIGLFALMPPVWSIAVAIWKDVAAALFLLAAVVGLARGRLGFALLALVGAVCSRHNAVLAAVPLLGALVWQLTPRLRSRLALLGIGCLALAAAPSAVNRLFRAHDDWVVAWIYTDDLAAMYQRRPELFQGSMFAQDFSARAFGELYNRDTSWPIFYGPPGAKRVDLEALPARKAELFAEWRRVISSAPATYLATRLNRFTCLLGLDCPAQYLFHEAMTPNPWELKLTTHTAAHRLLRWVQVRSAATPLFAGWFWLGALCALVALGFRRRERGLLPLAVSLSGLSYLGGYFLVGPAADFRYLFWSIVSVFAALVLHAGRSDRGAVVGLSPEVVAPPLARAG